MTTTKSNGHPSLAGLLLEALRLAEGDLEGFEAAYLDDQLWYIHDEMRERAERAEERAEERAARALALRERFMNQAAALGAAGW
jgi:hypothetical protein